MATKLLLTLLLLSSQSSYGWVSSGRSSSNAAAFARSLPAGTTATQRVPFVTTGIAVPRSKTAQPMYASKDSRYSKLIDIDDVMLEATSALKAAQDALEDEAPATRRTPTSQTQEVIASTMGGIMLGSIVGCAANGEIPDLNLLINPSVAPVELAAILGTVGIAGGMADTKGGEVVRTLLGKPTKAAVKGVGKIGKRAIQALGSAAKRQVEKTTAAIKAMPSKVANSVARKAEETVEKIEAFPSRVAYAAKVEVEKTTAEIKVMGRKITNSAARKAEETVEKIVSVPSRVGYAAKREVEKTTAEIKAIGRKINNSAARKAEETVENIVAFPSRVGFAAKRQVKKTTAEIEAMRVKVANSAARKAEETVEKIVAFPSRVGYDAKLKTLEVVDNVKISVGHAADEAASLPDRALQKENLPLILIPSIGAISFVIASSLPSLMHLP